MKMKKQKKNFRPLDSLTTSEQDSVRSTIQLALMNKLFNPLVMKIVEEDKIKNDSMAATIEAFAMTVYRPNTISFEGFESLSDGIVDVLKNKKPSSTIKSLFFRCYAIYLETLQSLSHEEKKQAPGSAVYKHICDRIEEVIANIPANVFNEYVNLNDRNFSELFDLKKQILVKNIFLYLKDAGDRNTLYIPTRFTKRPKKKSKSKSSEKSLPVNNDQTQEESEVLELNISPGEIKTAPENTEPRKHFGLDVEYDENKDPLSLSRMPEIALVVDEDIDVTSERPLEDQLRAAAEAE